MIMLGARKTYLTMVFFCFFVFFFTQFKFNLNVLVVVNSAAIVIRKRA